MKYIELKRELGGFTLFSLADIRKADRAFHRRRLNEWQDKGYIRKIITGYYIFSDLSINENVLFEIANRIYNPSYISFETALSYYGLIPESVYGITSASSKKTTKFVTDVAEFSYRTIAPRLFFGFDIVRYNDKCFKIAEIEKAILDFLYNNPHLKTKEDFISLRINTGPLFNKADKNKLDNYLERFSQKRLTKRARIFWEAAENA